MSYTKQLIEIAMELSKENHFNGETAKYYIKNKERIIKEYREIYSKNGQGNIRKSTNENTR